MDIEILLGCVLVGIIAMFVLFVGFVNEEEQRMQEVKVFDGKGKLKKVITVKQLQKDHWQRFYNSTKFGDQKNKSMDPEKQKVSISD